MEQNASCLPKAQWLSGSIHDCIHFHFMLQQPLSLTGSSCVAAPPLVSSHRWNAKKNPAQATMDTWTPLQCVTRLWTADITHHYFLNSHCNQPCITRILQTFILLPKLPQAWHLLHMNLQWLEHTINILPRRVCAMWNHQAGSISQAIPQSSKRTVYFHNIPS